MLEQGLIEEVERLHEMRYSPDLPSMQSIGYKHVNKLLAGEWDQAEMLEYLIRDTRRYAKRQMTWFNKNKALHWFNRQDHDLLIRRIESEISL